MAEPVSHRRSALDFSFFHRIKRLKGAVIEHIAYWLRTIIEVNAGVQ
jgi:hypothetical protein